MSSAIIRRSIRAYYISQFFFSAYFPLAIYLLYYHSYIGLSFFQAMLLFAGTWVPSILFDLVGGAMADKYGRKRTYIVGVALFIVGSLLPVLLFRNFPLLVGLALIGGWGAAMVSNSLDSILPDLLHNDSRRFRIVNAHAQVVVSLSRMVAAIVGGYLYTLNKPLPFVVYIAACIIAAIAAIFIHEPAKTSRDTKVHALALEAINHVRRAAPIIRWAALLSCFGYFAGNLLMSYYQIFFSNHAFTPAVIGIILAVASLCSAGGSWLVKHLHHKKWRSGIILICIFLTILNGLGFATDTPSIAILTIMTMAVAAGMWSPTLRLIVNEHTPSRIRTSTLSVVSTLTAIAILFAYLVSGFVADRGNAVWAGGLAVIFGVISLLFYIGWRPHLLSLLNVIPDSDRESSTKKKFLSH
jgi:MFS family permease